ncbi:MAG: response regulator [Bacteroidia bacterium]
MNHPTLLHILVVEDDPVVRADLTDALFSLGYAFVSEAGDAIQARELMENDLPDLVILDIHLGAGRMAFPLHAVSMKNTGFPLFSLRLILTTKLLLA